MAEIQSTVVQLRRNEATRYMHSNSWVLKCRLLPVLLCAAFTGVSERSGSSVIAAEPGYQNRGASMATLDFGTGMCAGAPMDCDKSNWYASSDVVERDQFSSACALGAMPRRKRGDSSAIGPVLLARSSQTSSANSQSPFERIVVKSEPKWINAGVWSLSDPSLLVLDYPRASILHFSLNLQVVNQVATFDSRTGDQLQPARIQTDGSSYLIEGGDGVLTILDKNYSFSKRFGFKNQGVLGKGFIGSMNQWVPVGNGSIISFGDISSKPDGKGEWFSALFRFSYDRPKDFKVIQSWDSRCRTKDLARLGTPILAKVGSSAYILLAEGESGIYEVGETLRRLNAFPSGYRAVPKTDYNGKTEDIPRVYRQLESLQGAVGLYGQGNFLYLLTRQPDIDGEGTMWILHKIDPRTDQVLGDVTLESKSPHITLLPGSDEWAIFEKGRVEKAWEQRIDAILRVSAAWIEGSASSPATAASVQPRRVLRRGRVLTGIGGS